MGQIIVNEQNIKAETASISEKNNNVTLETASLQPTGISSAMTQFDSLYNRFAKAYALYKEKLDDDIKTIDGSVEDMKKTDAEAANLYS